MLTTTILLTAALALSGCGFLGEQADVAVPDVTVVAGMTASRPSGKALTNDNWSLALDDADRYKGSAVDLTGQIFNVLGEYDGASHYQLFTDVKARAGNTHLAVPPSGVKLQEGDLVRVVGTLEKMLVVNSRGGRELRLPYVNATPVEVNGKSLVATPTVEASAVTSATVTVAPETPTEPPATETVAATATIGEMPAPSATTTPIVASPATPPAAPATATGPFNREYSSADFWPGSTMPWSNDSSSPTGQYLSSNLSNKDWNGALPVPGNGSLASLSITIPEPGRYAIWLRMEYLTLDANSVWMMVDNQRAVLLGNEDGGYGAWKWVGWRDGNVGNRVTVELTAGTHTLTVVSREAGTRFDRALVTDDLSFRPSDPAAPKTPATATPTQASVPPAATGTPTQTSVPPPPTPTPVAIANAPTPSPTAVTVARSASPTATTVPQSTAKPTATAVPSPTKTPPPSTPPPTPTRAPTSTSQAPTGSYTVQPGDTLSAIAQRLYGDAGQFPRIYDANRDKLSSPDLIRPGTQLRIP